MRKSGTQQNTTIITCQNCNKNVLQNEGTRRTICPHCGNLFQPATVSSASSRRSNMSNASCDNDIKLENYPRRGSASNGQTKRKSSASSSASKLKKSPGQKVINFFENIGKSNKKNQRGDSQHLVLPSINSNPNCKSPSPSMNKASSMNSLMPLVTPRQETPTVCQFSVDEFHKMSNYAKDSQDWNELSKKLENCFSSAVELNSVFKLNSTSRNLNDSGINTDFLKEVYSVMMDMPYEYQKKVLKANIAYLLQKNTRSANKDELRALYIMLQNPLFEKTSTFVLFAHLLRTISGLADYDHHYIVKWTSRLDKTVFSGLIHRLHNFISVRLFPSKPGDLPPMSKATWWVPSAVRVLALLYAANNLNGIGTVVSANDFYNYTLDHLDLLAEYYSWQNPTSHPGFTFCQYPFILSINAKKIILQRDSEQQMIIMAKRSLVQNVQKRQMPNMDMLFLNISVRRSHLVSDSLKQIASKKNDLKKKLKVSFEGEPGLDMGGLTKEWFLLVLRSILQADSGLFDYNKASGLYWFSLSPKKNVEEYFLIGALMGLAVYNSINLDVRFPLICYKKLLSPIVVPQDQPDLPLGICPVSLSNLFEVMPDVAQGLSELLKYNGNVQEDFSVAFEISYYENGKLKTAELRPGGMKTSVTENNREEYVQMYCDFVLNRGIFPKFKSFYLGFHSVCASNALIMLRADEVEHLVCGSPTFDFEQLRKVTVLEGFRPNDAQIKWFWNIAANFDEVHQKALLLFITGSDRVPVGGMGEMHLKIVRVNNLEMLPIAHTCFNQIMLPPYKTKAILKEKLLVAIDNSEGFGLE